MFFQFLDVASLVNIPRGKQVKTYLNGEGTSLNVTKIKSKSKCGKKNSKFLNLNIFSKKEKFYYIKLLSIYFEEKITQKTLVSV